MAHMSSADALAAGSPGGPTPQRKGSMGSRHSPVTPLAPLEYLQNQRRGSITDPSLHAGPPMAHAHSALSSIPPSLRIDHGPGPNSATSQASHEPQTHSPLIHPRAGSPYKAAESPAEGTNLRRLLRTPSDHGGGGGDAQSGGIGSAGANDMIGDGRRGGGSMDIDASSDAQQQEKGTKRKFSQENVEGIGNSEIDPALVGPRIPSAKRRGSGFETQRMGELSLEERRGSADGRGGWIGERRESVASSSLSTPQSGYTPPGSAIPGESPHGRGGGIAFAWPTNPHPDQAHLQQMHHDQNADLHPLPYEALSPMPPSAFPQDRRMSASNVAPDQLPPSTGPARVLRSRSRPPSRVRGAEQPGMSSAGPSSATPLAETPKTEDALLMSPDRTSGSTPYSRSPELRISHKLAERKRRKEMKDLFDELREQLPSDRGMKSSKWEILSKAIDFIVNLKQSHQEMTREIEVLRHELDSIRQGIPPFPPGAPHVVYGHPPPVGVPTFPPPGGPAGAMHPPQGPLPGQQQQQPPHPTSRPGSSQNVFPPGGPPAPMPQNMNGNPGAPRTDTPS